MTPSKPLAICAVDRESFWIWEINRGAVIARFPIIDSEERSLSDARQSARNHLKVFPGARVFILADYGDTEPYVMLEHYPPRARPKQTTMKRRPGSRNGL